ncbi:hypothetical protein ACO0KY_17705 [Undibacterium sp. Dicai25W]|uniref:hypothetical protein n=1 Tax=Undibacterium sp. Dicai25W TaxID=3413034 RepID=UPI003BF2582F
MGFYINRNWMNFIIVICALFSLSNIASAGVETQVMGETTWMQVAQQANSSANARAQCLALASSFGIEGKWCTKGKTNSPEVSAFGFGNVWVAEEKTFYLVKVFFCESENKLITGIDNQCVDVKPLTDTSRSFCLSCARSIKPNHRNVSYIERDFVGQHIDLTRFYNIDPKTIDTDIPGVFGMRWSSSFDVHLELGGARSYNELPYQCYIRNDTKETLCKGIYRSFQMNNPASVTLVQADGKRLFFYLKDKKYAPVVAMTDAIIPTYSINGILKGWTHTYGDNNYIEIFDSDGLLLSTKYHNGKVLKFTYSSGASNNTAINKYPANAPTCRNVQAGQAVTQWRLLCVTDNAGHQINFEYDISNRIKKIFDESNQPYIYEYDGVSGGCTKSESNEACHAGNLTKVTFPDGKARTYLYNELPKINAGKTCVGTKPLGAGLAHLKNALTGLVDENNVRNKTWNYDCSGLLR